MKNFKKIFGKKGLACTALLAIVLFFSASIALAQQSFIIDPASSMTVSGTSSLHDWTSDVTKLNGSAQIAVQGNQIESIDRLSLNIPVTSIKSGKSGMEKNRSSGVGRKGQGTARKDELLKDKNFIYFLI